MAKVELVRESCNSGIFTLTRNKHTGEMLDLDVEYPEPPEEDNNGLYDDDSDSDNENEVVHESNNSGVFTLTRNKHTGEIVDFDVGYPEPPAYGADVYCGDENNC